ncbi:CIA30 family protein [Massilia sp. ST3]|uniref:CIA30 family protein n=1 Tax=Massilia sp. ST3 TaxID=2824903 RepID=UPI001B8228C1|nr:CIA30 family protein [Massilia sp. ST3]MBQ5950047.1 CIA30 family protein [Massilia sp. ST3]
MNTTALKAVLAAAGFTLSGAVLAAATLVQDVRVFDGKHAHQRRSVLFEGGAIVDADFRGSVPQGARVVPGAGRTLLPGLIDAHTHAFRDHDLPLLFGVTTQVDMFTGVPLMQEMKAAMKAGKNAGRADMFSAGTLVTAPGGHGTQFGMAIPTLVRAQDAQAFVDARIAEGSDFIKIVMEGGGHGMRKFETLDLATVKAVIGAAHRRGKLAVVHVSTERDARAVLEAGADGLVHLFPGEAIPQERADSLARLARAKGAFVIPTFTVLESMAGTREDDLLRDPRLAGLLDGEAQGQLKARYGATEQPALLAAPRMVTAALRRAGVPLLAGSDAGNAGTQYGISMHRELAALVEAGLSPAEALAASTSAPAAAFKLGRRGCVATGCKADLLLVEGDPTTDITATRRIVEVWKDGESVNPMRDAKRLRVAQRQAGGTPPGGALLALPPDGRISLFSEAKLGSPFGSGWMPTTDAIAGGKSTTVLAAQPALGDGQVPLAISGSIAPGLPYAWAGAAFMPGERPMQAVDLSAAKLVRFKVRGDGGTYRAMMMAQGVAMPGYASFTAGPEWAEVSIPFSAFRGIDPAQATMIGFTAGPKAGAYRFEIADVRLLER